MPISRENTCARVSFLNKIAALMPATLLKEILWHRCCTVSFKKNSKNTFLTEHLQTAAFVNIPKQMYSCRLSNGVGGVYFLCLRETQKALNCHSSFFFLSLFLDRLAKVILRRNYCVVIHDTCDQDYTCFLRHTGKCFRIRSDGSYSRHW